MISVFGPDFAEVPFLATADGHRRRGHARRLLATLEGLLRAAGVGSLAVPAVKSLLGMWTASLG